jgi:hypothetical protein
VTGVGTFNAAFDSTGVLDLAFSGNLHFCQPSEKAMKFC